MKELLLVIDMQNDFITGSLANEDAQKMVPKLVKKLEKNTKDLIFTLDTHGENYLETQEGKNLPVKHCIKNTEGWQIIPELAKYVAKAKYVVEKTAFGGASLIGLVKEYDSIELVGVCTDICVVSNALILKTFYPEKLISVDKKCCAGVTKKSHNAAIITMQSCQIRI